MKSGLLLSATIALLSAAQMPSASFGYAAMPAYGCGTACYSSMYNYCPTCAMRGYYGYNTYSPWGTPSPWWWNTGPMMYSNFYQPAPWYQSMYWNNSYSPAGVMPGYYPGGGSMFAAKPNLYVEGPQGTEVRIKVKFTEEGANWLATVPSHGAQGWQGKLDRKNRIQTEQGTYQYLYSDYRMHGRQFQDQEGFCSTKENVLGKIAGTMNQAGFTGMEVADFLEYWSVKFPQSEKFCVYPQDERQLETVAALEVTPKPASVRRLLFMVQPQENIEHGTTGEKFASAPVREWKPQPIRGVASDKAGIKIREWGIGFFAAKTR